MFKITNKIFFIFIFLAVLFLSGVYLKYFWLSKSVPGCGSNPCPVVFNKNEIEDKNIYKNDQFGFTLNLSEDWQGYTVTTTPIEFGSKVILHHPKWSGQNTYEDIPILIYLIEQWKKWESNNFEDYPTAAPIGPSERGRNNMYVFATAPRYNYDFSVGWENVENIIKTLKGLNKD